MNLQFNFEGLARRIRAPWAKRYHVHPSRLDYATCAKCGHVILIGHVRNREVKVTDRSKGYIEQRYQLYGESCAPAWDTEEIALDGKVRHYRDGVEV